MSVNFDSCNLANNYQKADIFTQSFRAYSNLTSRTFKPLPDSGKAFELAKRVGVIAAPVIYPLFGACMIAAQGDFKLTRWYASNLLEEATIKMTELMNGTNKGKGPYELVVLLSVQSQNTTLYADLITLKSDQFSNGKLPFFLEKMQQQQQLVKKNLKEARFHLGQEIDIKWEGFLKNGDGNFSSMCGFSSCDSMLVTPYGGSGFGSSGFNNVEEVKSVFQKRLQTLKVNPPLAPQHFVQ